VPVEAVQVGNGRHGAGRNAEVCLRTTSGAAELYRIDQTNERATLQHHDTSSLCAEWRGRRQAGMAAYPEFGDHANHDGPGTRARSRNLRIVCRLKAGCIESARSVSIDPTSSVSAGDGDSAGHDHLGVPSGP